MSSSRPVPFAMSHIIGEIRSDLLRTRFARTLTRRTVGLGFVAGFVNTVGFFDPHVYPGIMTGNTVQLGIALAQSDWHLFRLIALTIAFFLGGGIAGSLIRRHLKRPPLELIVTAVLPLDATPFRTKTSNTIPVELGLLAVTMAIQGETVPRIGTVPIQIVVVTNNLVHFTDELVGRFLSGLAATEVRGTHSLPNVTELAIPWMRLGQLCSWRLRRCPSDHCSARAAPVSGFCRRATGTGHAIASRKSACCPDGWR